jgi:cyclohexanecarboxylate-CoA ligase
VILAAEQGTSCPPHQAPGQKYYSAGYWTAEDLWTTCERVGRARATANAFICDAKQLTFSELLSAAAAVGANLRTRGIRPGDLVIVHGRNCIESAVALLACAWLGAVMVPLPPMFTDAQLTAIADSSGARATLCLGKPDEIERAVNGAARSPTIQLIVVLDDCARMNGVVRWSELLNDAGHAQRRDPVDSDALAVLVYSSGTTGVPKGVMHSSNTVRYAVQQRAALHDVGANDVCLLVCQFGFVGGVVFGLLAGMLVGCTTVILKSWNPADALRLIAQYRATYGLFMPTHVHDLLGCAELPRTEVSSLRRAAMGGLSKAHREQVRQQLCPLPLPGYGMSECLGNSTCSAASPLEKLLETDGRAYPGTECIIAGNDEEVLGPGHPGAVWVRGPSRCLGYYRAPDISAAAFTADGFFRTGDRGVLDELGFLTFLGRDKDVIRRGGVTIVPTEVEAALLAHPDIRQVALVGLPDARLVERVCACVITVSGSRVELGDLRDFLESKRVAKYMWPEFIAHCVEFPMTPSLKIKKAALVDQLVRGQLTVSE